MARWFASLVATALVVGLAAQVAAGAITVAVVDSGVDGNHPGLAGKVLPGWNVITGTADVTDVFGHGTSVAGIIVATPIATCSACFILPVKAVGANGVGGVDDVARGIVWAVDHGARVINVSIGSFYDSQPLRNAVAYARAHDDLVVAAAGNAGPNLQEFPAADPGAIAVAGVNPLGQLYPWSNAGDWVQFAGRGVISTTWPGGSWREFKGTSAAAPAVAGIAASVFAAVPGATAVQVQAALELSAVPTAGVRYGTVSTAAAVAAVLADPTLSHPSPKTTLRRATPTRKRAKPKVKSKRVREGASRPLPSKVRA